MYLGTWTGRFYLQPRQHAVAARCAFGSRLAAAIPVNVNWPEKRGKNHLPWARYDHGLRIFACGPLTL